MAYREKIVLAIKVLLPVFLILLFNPAPSPVFLKNANMPFQGKNPGGQSYSYLPYLKKLVSLEPWRGEIWEQIGTAEIKAQNPAGAIGAFQKARTLQNLSPAAVLSLGDLYVQMGNIENAILTWKTLADKPQYTIEAYERMLQTDRDRKDYSAEADVLRLWLLAAPQNSQAAFRLGLILSATNSVEAENFLSLAAVLDPSLSLKVTAMKEALSTDAAAQPESYSKVIIGRALGKIGEWDLAANAFKSAVTLSPNYAEAWAFLGEARLQSGQDGYPDLINAEKINPDSVLAKSFLSLYWQRQGDPGAALAYLYTVAELEPAEPAWQIELGQLLANTGNNTPALYHFQKAVELKPASSDAWQALANFCIETDFEIISIGLPAARQALALAPGSPQSNTVMGSALLASGDLIDGEKFLTRAVEIDRKFVPAQIQLGLLYTRLGQRDSAFYYFNKAVLYSSKDSPDGLMSRRLLKAYFGIDN